MTDEKKKEDEGHGAEKKFQIQIDRVHYTVVKEKLTGLELRHVPPTPIGPERDLFEVIPGKPDKKIENDAVVEIYNGVRFFTAPGHINPGAFAPQSRRG